MWLFTTGGFFSIVEHKDDPATHLLVRARVKGDIEKYWPTAKVQKLEDADYLYRAKIPRSDVMNAVFGMVGSIDYTSFKGAVKDKARYWRYYNDVNARMQEMQEDMQHESHPN